MKNNKALLIISVALILNIIATGILGLKYHQLSKPQDTDTGTQYVMYVGTNDKDTYEQVIPTDQAKEIIDKICFEYVEGYTIQDATGSWVDEKGIPTHENTIVCYFDDTDEETVHKIADKIISALNQNTVLIEQDTVKIEYYGGN